MTCWQNRSDRGRSILLNTKSIKLEELLRSLPANSIGEQSLAQKVRIYGCDLCLTSSIDVLGKAEATIYAL